MPSSPRHPVVVSPRTVTLAGSALLVVLLTTVAALLPVPYVLESPGPMANVVGSVDGEQLIVIEGERTYPTAGNLDLTTVKVAGGPGRSVDLVSALRGWLDPTVAVVPEEVVYPQGTTRRQIEDRNTADMQVSQRNATAAALRALDQEVTEVPAVASVLKGAPADGVIEPGDVLLAVDGEPVSTQAEVQEAITARRPGEDVEVTVRRGAGEQAEELTLTVPTEPADGDAGRAVVGIGLATTFEFPFTVEIKLEDIGGPSAGLMFALGIVDKLTPGELNDGRYVAGTGTIAPDGAVGSIGGIPQKMVAADRAGAELFLAPVDNCDEVATATPEGLEVVAVQTLDDALEALEAFREGDLAGQPRCTS